MLVYKKNYIYIVFTMCFRSSLFLPINDLFYFIQGWKTYLLIYLILFYAMQMWIKYWSYFNNKSINTFSSIDKTTVQVILLNRFYNLINFSEITYKYRNWKVYFNLISLNTVYLMFIKANRNEIKNTLFRVCNFKAIF